VQPASNSLSQPVIKTHHVTVGRKQVGGHCRRTGRPSKHPILCQIFCHHGRRSCNVSACPATSPIFPFPLHRPPAPLHRFGQELERAARTGISSAKDRATYLGTQWLRPPPTSSTFTPLSALLAWENPPCCFSPAAFHRSSSDERLCGDGALVRPPSSLDRSPSPRGRRTLFHIPGTSICAALRCPPSDAAAAVAEGASSCDLLLAVSLWSCLVLPLVPPAQVHLYRPVCRFCPTHPLSQQ